MALTDEVEDLKLNIANLLHMNIWDDETKSSLDTYMRLRNVQYLVEDDYPNEAFWMAIKVDGKIYRLDMGSSFTTVQRVF